MSKQGKLNSTSSGCSSGCGWVRRARGGDVDGSGVDHDGRAGGDPECVCVSRSMGLTRARAGADGCAGGDGAGWAGVAVVATEPARSVETAEAAHPEFEQRLVTFQEKESAGNDPFMELLAADTLRLQKTRLGGAGRAETLMALRVLAWRAGRAGVDDCGGAGVSGLWRFAAVDGAEERCAPLYRYSGDAGRMRRCGGTATR